MMSKALEFSKKYRQMLTQCARCGFCRAVCPIFDIIKNAAANAGGKMILLKELMDGKVEPSEGIVKSLLRCTSCNACTYLCPAGIKVDQIIQKGREKLFASGFTPEPVTALRDSILNTDNVYAATREDRIAIYPPSIKKKVETGEVKKKADTLLFMGCVSSYLDMKIVPSFFKIMDAAGVNYTMLGKNEICCGFPLHLMGDQEKFEQNARNLIDLIKATGAKELVTPCAGCYKTFKKYYPEAGDLGVKLFHSVQYIQKLIEEKKIQFGGDLGKKITYHDPCDLGRTFEIFDEPREILKAIPDIDFVEMNRNRLMARCCGGGGSVIALEPELAVDMAAVRVKDAVEVDAEIIVSGCSACKDNLRKGLKAIPKDERPKIKVMDITEVVANSIIE
jgi:Fe-S oxidoreductase